MREYCQRYYTYCKRLAKNNLCGDFFQKKGKNEQKTGRTTVSGEELFSLRIGKNEGAFYENYSNLFFSAKFANERVKK